MEVDDKRGFFTQLLVFHSILVTIRSAVFRSFWNSPQATNYDSIMGHRLYAPINTLLNQVLPRLTILGVYDVVKNLALSTITKAIKAEDSCWKAVLNLDAQIYEDVSNHPFEVDEVPFLLVINTLVWDLVGLDDTLCSFYLMTLSEMLRCAPSYEWLKPLLHEQIDVYHYGDVFKPVTFNLVEPLRPITGLIGLHGGKSALNTMIEEYAARSPTRAEMISRLREIPSQ